MNKDSHLNRLLILLLLTLGMGLGLYYLPGRLFGYPVKKVDLLSDIRLKPEALSLDSLRRQWEEPDSLVVDSTALRDSVHAATGIDSAACALRDSLYKKLSVEQGADSAGTRIEDYSLGHTGLKHFFAVLNKRQEIGRPVRVAFLGDSFIEGDILVADFRSGLQKRFGGRGVGFVPVTSVAAQFRPTVEQRAKGWKTWSILTDHTQRYTLPGMTFEAREEKASLSVRNSKRYPELPTVSSLKLIYERNEQSRMQLICNGGTDTVQTILPPASEITQYERTGTFTEADFSFTEARGFYALGVVMEDSEGVVVDNFSLRGNSGMILERLDTNACRAFNRIRPYDLIVLQYGLNVVTDTVMKYGWYGNRMVKVIRHIQRCFPEADLLLLGVSDRSRQRDGTFETMPAVWSLLHTQRQIAKQAGIPFWNVFGAMGGENSMVRYVKNNWASKDYTHLGFRGGKEIAGALLKALLSEKEFYDEAEKMVD